MKILAFADVHGNKSAIERLVRKAEDVDLIICAGDISNWQQNLKELFLEFKKSKKLILVIHGNHEEHHNLVNIVKDISFVKVIHKKIYRLGDYVFFGYGGGGFALEDKNLDKMIPDIKKSIKRNDKLIFVTHAPPFNTRLDFLEWVGHVGCNSKRRFIEKLRPELCICGHLHENAKMKDKINETLIINPGADGLILRI